MPLGTQFRVRFVAQCDFYEFDDTGFAQDITCREEYMLQLRT